MTTKEIVVGLAGGASSTAALRWAVEQATRTGARLRVVHVGDVPMAELSSSAAAVGEARKQDARARTSRTVNDVLDGTSVGTTWVLDMAEGTPGPVLVSRSRSADLLVLGTRERVGLRRAVTRSVGQYVLSHAHCPVVAVPPPVRVPARAL